MQLHSMAQLSTDESIHTSCLLQHVDKDGHVDLKGSQQIMECFEDRRSKCPCRELAGASPSLLHGGQPKTDPSKGFLSDARGLFYLKFSMKMGMSGFRTGTAHGQGQGREDASS